MFIAFNEKQLENLAFWVYTTDYLGQGVLTLCLYTHFLLLSEW